MLVTITYSGENSTDLGYLLHKNPSRPQVFELNHGRAYVFYPEASPTRTTAALLLELDPVGLVRRSGQAGLFDYVNDRPYVSSSFMSTAISKVFGTAMTGRCDARQELADTPLDLAATVTMLPCRGDQERLISVFTPLGYEVSYESFEADEEFPDWGRSAYVNLTLVGKVRLRDLLRHLYVLIPVFDAQKHYWISADEVEKLLRAGEDWLADHPEKDFITARYLRRRPSLINLACERLAAEEEPDEDELDEPEALVDGAPEAEGEPDAEPVVNLNTQRLDRVVAELKSRGVRQVIDLGCGEGNLLRRLVADRQFTRIAGVDVSASALQYAARRLHWERASEAERQRLQLFQGSLTYRDERFAGYDAACLVEVVEHLDPSRLEVLERVVFEFAQPSIIVVTTPNREYNVNYQFLKPDEARHSDHRFEWTRAEFQQWANAVGERFGYTVEFSGIGDVDPDQGTPTQMGVFTR